MIELNSLSLLREAASLLEKSFHEMPGFTPEINIESLREVLLITAERLGDNYPYFHPLYAGQMLKPPHPLARLAYALALWINPNNHALDGGKASSLMEKECLADLAKMIGWSEHLGHLCSGGTIANLEAIWIASSITNRRKVLASQQAHYTHARLCKVLGIPFESIPCDSNGRMDCTVLEEILHRDDVGTVIATMGTTATGAIDPLDHILELRSTHNFVLHADAAYGGYFTLANNLDRQSRNSFNCLKDVDSIVIDPHKHGLQPYGCGCVIFRDKSVMQFYKHDSPYTYFTSDELHLGEISLECSRPGASAIALWATQKLLPMVPEGEFATMLTNCRTAAITLYSKLAADKRFIVGPVPELDIVVWSVAGETASEMSRRSKLLFEQCQSHNLFLALADIPASFFPNQTFVADQNYVSCLRSCLIKPEHLDWVDDIWQRLNVSIEVL